MTRRMRWLTVLAIALLSSWRTPHANGDALPADLEVRMQSDRRLAAFLQVHADGDEKSLLTCTETLHAYVRFSNTPVDLVAIEWSAQRIGPPRVRGQQFTRVPVSFRVTDVAAASPRSTTMFVAGWCEREGQAVVEQWDFAVTFTETTKPLGKARFDIAVEPIRRARLFASDALAPIKAIAYHPVSDTLALLEHGAGGDLHLLDCARGELAGVLLKGDDEPSLSTMSSMWVTKYEQRGYVLGLTSRSGWSAGLHRASILAVPDPDGDGRWAAADAQVHCGCDFVAEYPSELALNYHHVDVPER